MDKRGLSNFIEFATTQYLTSSEYIGDDEMDEILRDEKLKKSLKKGLEEVKLSYLFDPLFLLSFWIKYFIAPKAK